MSLHDKSFLEELYAEHLEEAAYLYETRLSWLHDETIAWPDIAELDERLDAHLDALVVGGEFALQMCFEILADCDAYTLHAVVRLFCRHCLNEGFARLWSDFDFADKDKVNSVTDALKWECPAAWFGSVLNVFASSKNAMYPLLAPCVAFRLRQSGQALLAALARTDAEHLPALIWSISRCELPARSQAIAVFGPYLKHENSEVVQQAAKALLIFGERRALAACASRIADMPMLFALGGNASECQVILQNAQQGVADADSLTALGILGELTAVPVLLSYLKHPDLAQVAAQSLQLISGASLYENTHLADEVEEDELFDFEVEAFKRGELPKNIDGKPFGAEVNKLRVDYSTWAAWFQDNKSAFVKGQRYRHGRLYSPRELLNNLLDSQYGFKNRSLFHDELMIRFGMTRPFFADDLIVNQQTQLNHIYRWIEETGSLFPEGRWTFIGEEI